MKLQELVLFCWCRSLELPKTQPVSWPKCWNCEPKIVSILITCAFWKFHLHSCAVYVILHDTSIYFWYLMFFGCIGPSLIAASHKQQTGNQISWCFSTLLGNISHQITALPHCHQTQKQDSIQLVVRVALFVRTARDQHLFTSKSAPLVDAASLIMVSDVVLHSVCTLYSRSEYFASKKSPFFFCFTVFHRSWSRCEINVGGQPWRYCFHHWSCFACLVAWGSLVCSTFVSFSNPPIVQFNRGEFQSQTRDFRCREEISMYSL